MGYVSDLENRDYRPGRRQCTYCGRTVYGNTSLFFPPRNHDDFMCAICRQDDLDFRIKMMKRLCKTNDFMI